MIKNRVVVHQGSSAEEAGRAALSLIAMGLESDTRRVQQIVAAASQPENSGPSSVRREETAGADAGQSVSRDLAQPEGSADPAQPIASATAGDDSDPSRPRVRILARTLWQVCVDEGDAEAARGILTDAFAPEETTTAPIPPVFRLHDPAAGIWTARNAASSLVIAAICVSVHFAVHGLSGGPSPRSTMIAAGAVAPWLVDQGQWWRLASAVFLHFDLQHLVGNMSSLLFLGPPLAGETGHLRLAFLFLATGILGNVVSQAFGDEVAIRAGASGGLCGILGALAGVAIAAMALAKDSRGRRPAWQTLGALVALFGMIVGFEPGHDHYAHVGGVVSGVLLGRLLGLRPGGDPA